MTRRVCGTAVAFLYLSSFVSLALGQQYYLYSPKPLSADEKAQAKEGVLVRDVPVQKGDTLYGLSRKYSGHGSYYPQILLFNEIKNPNLIYAGDVVKVPVTKEQPAEDKGRAPAAKKVVEQPAAASPKGHAVPAQKQPAAAKGTVESTELSLSELKRVDTGKHKKRAAKKKSKPCVQKQARSESIPTKQQKAVEVGQKPEPTVRAGSFVASPPVEQQPQQYQPSRQPELSQPIQPSQPAPSHGSDTTSGQKLFEKAVKSYRQDDCRTALELFDRFLSENPSSPLAADASLYKAECYLKLSSQ